MYNQYYPPIYFNLIFFYAYLPRYTYIQTTARHHEMPTRNFSRPSRNGSISKHTPMRAKKNQIAFKIYMSVNNNRYNVGRYVEKHEFKSMT